MNKAYLLIIAVVVGLLIFRECEHRSDKKLWEKSMTSLDVFNSMEDSSFFAGKTIEVNDIKDQNQNQVATIEDIESIHAQMEDLKYINALIKTELHTKIQGNIGYRYDTVYLSNNMEEYIPRDSVKKYFLPKGTTASDSTLWYDINITLNDSLQIDSLKVRDKIDVILAYKKPKWWKLKEPVVRIQSYSPYTDIGYVNNLVVEDEKSKFAKIMTSKPMMVFYGSVLGYGIRVVQIK